MEVSAAGEPDSDAGGTNGVTGPRRLLRFDDQPTAEKSPPTRRCHRNVIRINGFPKNAMLEEQTTTNAAPSINGQLTSNCSADVAEKIDGNESECFCSSVDSAVAGVSCF